MEEKKSALSAAFKESSFLIFGELIVSSLIIAAYLTIDLVGGSNIFSYTVITGAIFGSLVIILNYFFLSLSINRAVNDFLKERGTGEMSEEEIADFTAKHQMRIQNAAKKSYFLRTVSMVLALVLAFITGWFGVVATLIPLVMLRPLIYLNELYRRKKGV